MICSAATTPRRFVVYALAGISAASEDGARAVAATNSFGRAAPRVRPRHAKTRVLDAAKCREARIRERSGSCGPSVQTARAAAQVLAEAGVVRSRHDSRAVCAEAATRSLGSAVARGRGPACSPMRVHCRPRSGCCARPNRCRALGVLDDRQSRAPRVPDVKDNRVCTARCFREDSHASVSPASDDGVRRNAIYALLCISAASERGAHDVAHAHALGRAVRLLEASDPSVLKWTCWLSENRAQYGYLDEMAIELDATRWFAPLLESATVVPSPLIHDFFRHEYSSIQASAMNVLANISSQGEYGSRVLSMQMFSIALRTAPVPELPCVACTCWMPGNVARHNGLNGPLCHVIHDGTWLHFCSTSQRGKCEDSADTGSLARSARCRSCTKDGGVCSGLCRRVLERCKPALIGVPYVIEKKN
ncbi:hypothetical protein B0H10DRAFT_1957498 [Mycena sp. CBHHK59/15]|nr:hypothetical protein B0H10DRAFT_1957498 [Mycena sp. CBHHK59/15]